MFLPDDFLIVLPVEKLVIYVTGSIPNITCLFCLMCCKTCSTVLLSWFFSQHLQCMLCGQVPPALQACWKHVSVGVSMHSYMDTWPDPPVLQGAGDGEMGASCWSLWALQCDGCHPWNFLSFQEGQAQFQSKPRPEGWGGQADGFPTGRGLQHEGSCFHFLVSHTHFPQTLLDLQAGGLVPFERSQYFK